MEKLIFAPCLYSHAPIDLVILGLGGNDMKTYFNRSAEQIKQGLAELVDMIQASEYGPEMRTAPQVLITTSAIPYPFVENVRDENGVLFLQGIVEKAKTLVPLYAQLADEKHCHFLDFSEEIFPSDADGVHFDLAAHRKVADKLYAKIKTIF